MYRQVPVEKYYKVVLAVVIFLVFTAGAEAQDVFDMDLSELGQISITSISKREESVSKAAAAVHVVTSEDIRRSGANSIPEILRTVPGLNVAQIDAYSWAISSRGFNGPFANKLLVLIDGRSVYTPIFSGVYWDQVDLVLEDIERIEVLRGPGAAVWGANAVNGIISIITKESSQTQGTLVSAGFGSREKLAQARHGGELGEIGHYRVYAKGYSADSLDRFDGTDNHDEWHRLQSGLRIDFETSEADRLTLLSDVQYGALDAEFDFVIPQPPFSAPAERRGHTWLFDVLGRWEHRFSPKSEVEFQLFFAQDKRDMAISDSQTDTYDAELQHNYQFSKRHDLTWGIGYRHYRSVVDPSKATEFGFVVDPRVHENDIANFFIQDEIVLLPEKWRLTLGAKLEQSRHIDAGFQPSARLAYTPTARQTVWAAYGRALRAPSFVELGFNGNFSVAENPDGPPVLVTIQNNPDSEAETVDSFELGYRITPFEELSFDVSAFYSHYERLQGTEERMPFLVEDPEGSYINAPLQFANSLEGSVYGTEAVVTWQARRWWRLQAWYAYLNVNIDGNEGNSNPRHQALLRSSMTIAENVEFDPTLRYVSRLPAAGFAREIDSYIELSARLGYRINPGVTLSLIGQNLLSSDHEEFSGNFLGSSGGVIPRSLFATVDWSL